MSAQCSGCGKTVYQKEALTAIGLSFHKGCFKCQSEGCGLQLTLKTYTGVAGKIYCSRHKPVDKPIQTTVDGSMALSNAKNIPKVGVVNDQVRNVEHKNSQVLDMAHTNAINRPKIGTVNEQVRSTEHKNAQVLDMAHTSAMNAPKKDVINEQVRGSGGNSQVLDMAHSNAMSTPKAFNPVNEQIRGNNTNSSVQQDEQHHEEPHHEEEHHEEEHHDEQHHEEEHHEEVPQETN